ncbi:MAG: glycerophosphodiester phosphodiesterase family protein [Bacteroidota bacterium]
MRYFFFYLCWLSLLLCSACRSLPKYDFPTDQLPQLQFKEVDQLKANLHQYALDRTPLISAHRGGPYPGYPENCLQTIKNLHRQIPAIFEIDIQMTKDSVLVLLHDKTLERTTNGNGILQAQTWKDIRRLRLQDPKGQNTSFHIPRFRKILRQLRHRTVLSLDIKRGVPFQRVIDEVKKYKAEASVMVIAYSIEDANAIHALAPELLISLGIYNKADLLEIEHNLKVPLDQIIAFTGTRPAEPELFAALRRMDIPIILGTLGKLDEQAAREGDSLYRQFQERGVDIFATDRPLEAAKVLYQE